MESSALRHYVISEIGELKPRLSHERKVKLDSLPNDYYIASLYNVRFNTCFKILYQLLLAVVLNQL
jgi:hypothetical protein